MLIFKCLRIQILWRVLNGRITPSYSGSVLRAMIRRKPRTRNYLPFWIRNRLPDGSAIVLPKRPVLLADLRQQAMWEHAVVALALHLEPFDSRRLYCLKAT